MGGMKTMSAFFCLCLFSVFAYTASAQESLHNLPVPRWAALASPEANLRTGPGKRYPIDWVLRKKNLPVEIIQEFEHWRRVKEPDGADGWIHKSMLTGMRHAMVKKQATLFAQPGSDTRVVATMQKGVIASVAQCHKKWCQLSVENFDGWTEKKALWGVYPDETWAD